MSISGITNQLSALSYAELTQLRAELAKLIEERAEQERQDLLTQMNELARERGFTGLDAVMTAKSDNSGKQRKRGTVAPKYRNPQNEAEIWTGRGRKPKWVIAALEAGGSLEDMLIDKD